MAEASNEFQVARSLSARAQQDLALIAAALEGSAKAYEQLLGNYRKSVYHVVLRMVGGNQDDAQDLTLEIFAKAFQYLARYRSDFAFSTWLFRIATNHCIDFVRRKKLLTQSLNKPQQLGDGTSYTLDATDQELNPQDLFIRQQRGELVQRVVARLPPKYERLVRLRYFEELSYEEVAAELQVPLGTVKARLFRARELLLALLSDSRTAL